MTLDDVRPLLGYPKLTIRQLAVILLLREGAKITLRGVAQKLGIPKPSVCRAYDGLGSNGLLKRERSHSDARDVYGVLTEEGVKLAGKLR